jgi:hypothetical protein
MASKQAAAKRRGTQYESDLVAYLRSFGGDAERLRLAGVADEGDIVLRERVAGETLYTVIEAKAEKEMNFSGYVTEAAVERKNYLTKRGLDPHMVDGIAVVKRPGKSVGESYVVTTLDAYLQIGKGWEQ